jgi:hypothetical protein
MGMSGLEICHTKRKEECDKKLRRKGCGKMAGGGYLIVR